MIPQEKFRCGAALHRTLLCTKTVRTFRKIPRDGEISFLDNFSFCSKARNLVGVSGFFVGACIMRSHMAGQDLHRFRPLAWLRVAENQIRADRPSSWICRGNIVGSLRVVD